ncbi:type I secretion system permease/ATPase [Enterovibrio nigricans]|uniref:ATP-binding cassette, subfamily B n=1 Tax=Enterovibrio nigricans DSM 22720 TaxID=1121868 RepID=A0A1T4TVS6_9GAMM|nr:type I secretion system permease/ATPase [Enterovibrio nigricans]SKA44555.1 ATP-binding cassette, subfamily B [Enterovibrio nigricans DSM 22720]
MSLTTENQLKTTLAQCKKALLLVVVFSFVLNLLVLAVPLYMLQIYDRVISSRSVDTLILLTVITVFALFTMAALENVRTRVMIRIGAWFDQSLSPDVLAGSIAMQLRRGVSASVQSLRDIAGIRAFIGGNAVIPALDAPWTPVFLGFVFLLHPLLGIIATVGALLLFAIAIINDKVTKKAHKEANESAILAMQQAESAARNADAIEAMGIMRNFIRNWTELNNQSIDGQITANSKGALLTATSKFLRMVLQIAMLGVGAWLVIQNQLTPGAMIAGSILMARALAPVEQSISAWGTAISAKQSYARLKEQIPLFPERAKSMPLPKPKGNVSVEKMTYFHPGLSEPVLHGITFKLNAGEALGIIGPSGTGKSTLARLLLGNLISNAGTVRLDNMDVSKWDPDDLGPHCGYLPQDVELFPGSIRHNIARMAEGEPDAVIHAAKLAGCHELILRQPQGYDTVVGERGLGLSGGERQRIALARALYGDPSLIILDEANANLDGVGEVALQRAIAYLKSRNATVILVGHRPSMMQTMDKLMVLQDSQIRAFGERDEVLKPLLEQSAAIAAKGGRK